MDCGYIPFVSETFPPETRTKILNEERNTSECNIFVVYLMKILIFY